MTARQDLFDRRRLAGWGLGVLASIIPSAALAAVTVSTDATQNMTCSNGVCAPTSTDAVLNVGDLENLLATGNVEVTTTDSGVQANDIVLKAALSWSASNTLALDAYRSISVANAVSVAGISDLDLTTNDGGSGGVLFFGPKGNVDFSSLSSALTINGASYTLVNTIQSLAVAIAANPSGDYAFANSYDARQDGTYTTVPIPTVVTGTLEGLGNTISHLSIKDSTDLYLGLFAQVSAGGALRDVALRNASVVTTKSSGANVGVLVGDNKGSVFGCFASGAVSGKEKRAGGTLGGLVGGNDTGAISYSHASTEVSNPQYGALGGLAGGNGGAIEYSYATGNVTSGDRAFIGGLVGENANSGSINVAYATGAVTGGNRATAGGLTGYIQEPSQVANSYATGAVSVGSGGPRPSRHAFGGGLVGGNGSTDGTGIANSYSTGTVSGGQYAYIGGSIGWNTSSATNAYWNTTTSGTDVGVGGGANQGVTGLTTAQLQSGLPAGFDPSIWGEKSNTNNGLPYLLAIPPKK